MPKELHDKLARQANKQGLTGERKDAYVYGTMNKIENMKKGMPDKGMKERMDKMDKSEKRKHTAKMLKSMSSRKKY